MKKFIYFAILLIISTLSHTFAQSFTSSDLPIVIIDTKNATILDEPKIPATLTIINNGKGKRNNLTDKASYIGTMGIEIRGSSTQAFPKKAYGMEIWDNKGNSIDTTFFGMPAESDWILYASYNEKSFMHSNLTMSISREMGMYGSRTQYVEVVLNGQYIGLYIWMEKIKRAKGRVDIAKLKTTDLKGDALTGGYIIKIDKNTGTNDGGWLSKYYNPTYPPDTKKQTFFLYDSPSDIQPAQQTYIHAFVDSLDDAMSAPTFADATNGFRKFLDSKSFAKYLIISEFTKAVDAYRYSTYFFKDKNSKDRKLKAGPPWDYDIAYGNANYYDGWKYTGFAYDFDKISGTNNDQQPHFWWHRMLQDPTFVAEVKTEYLLQRKQGALTNQNIKLHIDSLTTEITEAQARNFQKWQVLGQYVWPNPLPLPTSWLGEVNALRTWINARLAWLDENLSGVYTAVEPQTEPLTFTMEAYPNPFLETISIKIYSEKLQKATLSVLDISGKILDEKPQTLQVGDNIINLQLPDNQQLSNAQLLRLVVGDKVLTKKMVRQ